MGEWTDKPKPQLDKVKGKTTNDQTDVARGTSSGKMGESKGTHDLPESGSR